MRRHLDQSVRRGGGRGRRLEFEPCGSAHGTPPEADPPSVAIVTPGSAVQLLAAPADLEVEVEADDGEGWGVVGVELALDGQVVASVDAGAPWVFALGGAWELRARAHDWWGNVAESAPVLLVVERVPMGGDEEGGEGGPDGDAEDDAGASEDTGAESGDGDTGDPPGLDEAAYESGCGCRQATVPASAAWWLIGAVCWRRRRLSRSA